ncbi:DUF4097 domain-containing protein [Deinococcus alpinitundrae]|uniref:DUF4097 domain-containing protein n=1 Tax=Deinococcus alpinitundrae TaxID=468913 RepID=UPI00137B382B|nr:DUF4097 domain-containing protein [Deinococcus alpinitundrae]
MTPPRSSPFPHWSLPAALLRVSVTLGILTVLGGLFIASLQRHDLSLLSAQSSRVQQPLTGVRRLSLTLPPDLSHSLKLVSSSVPGLSAQLSASRQDELRLKPAPPLSEDTSSGNNPTRDLALTLSRHLRAWPLVLQLDAHSGLPGTLRLALPRRVALTLDLQHPADDSDLDLRELNIEQLTFVGDNGALRASLPQHGTPQLDVRSTGGGLDLTLPPGDARTTLDATSESGNITLNVPPSAQINLTVTLSGPSSPADLTLPASFRAVPAQNRQARRYLQTGQPGGPVLTARLELAGGSLNVNALNTTGVSP